MTTVESYCTKSDPEVLATYRRLLKAARALGRVAEEPTKTFIHLVRDTATSAHRWHIDVRLEKPVDVDRGVSDSARQSR